MRNLIYAGLFLIFGWFEVHGFWAVLAIAVLAAEVVVPLMDFVEEDLSRKLPASERVTHTLLAINYGALLALLVPVLGVWTALPTSFQRNLRPSGVPIAWPAMLSRSSRVS